MLARMLLVAMVAGMGLEPPSREDVSSAVQRGRVWIAARIDDWSITTARRAQEANDRAFRKVVDDMSRRFSEDLARMDAKKREENRPAFEPIIVADDLEPILVADAFETDVVDRLIAEGASRDDRLAVADEFASDVVADLIAASSRPDPLPVEAERLVRQEPVQAPATAPPPAPKAEGSPARVERLSSAVNLTRQAFVAWASLLTSSDAVATR